MMTSIGSILLYTLGAGVGLYILWELKEGLQCLMGRRRTKRSYERRGDSICRWGFNAAGELGHVRCKRTPDDNEAGDFVLLFCYFLYSDSIAAPKIGHLPFLAINPVLYPFLEETYRIQAFSDFD